MTTNCTAVAAVRLMLHHPFWCELFYSMKVIETENVQTLQTDGTRLWVNPTFWGKLSLDHKITALAHEVGHKMLHHCTRGRDFDPYWGNVAADIVVNTILSDNGFKLHPDWVQPEQWARGMAFEPVYYELMKRLKKDEEEQQSTEPQSGGGDGQDEADSQPGEGESEGEQGEDGEQEGQGGGGGEEEGEQEGQGGGGGQQGEPGKQGKANKDEPGDLSGDTPAMPDWAPKQWGKMNRDVEKFTGSEEARERFEQKVEQMVQNAIATAKAAGNAPMGVEMAVDAVREVKKEAWYDHLQRFMQSLTMSEYNWDRIDRRQAALFDIVAPDVFAPTLQHAVILVDASGSCFDKAQQANFFGHINAIMAEAKPKKISVMFFDTIVHKTVEVDPGEIEFSETPAGGGGTSFVQPLEQAEEEHADVIICLTDMYGDFPKQEPDCPVIWASVTPGVTAPFGETIFVQ